MSDHPTQAELKALLQGTLPHEPMKAVLSHLLGGCRECRSYVYPRIARLLSPEPLPVSREEEAGYDRAINNAIRTARRLSRERDLYQEALRAIDAEGPFGILNGPQRLRGPEGVQALLDRSWHQRRESPAQMVALARAATQVANDLEEGGETEDIRCRAWMELSNAQRVINAYDRAQESIVQAMHHLVLSKQKDELEVRLMDIQASLEGHLCNFENAFDILNVVAIIHQKNGDLHLAGRALISKGLFKTYHGETEEALDLTRRGRMMLDEDRDPSLHLQAVHNEVLALLDLERYSEARTLLWSNQGRYGKHAGYIDRLKLRGLWGRINAGLGKLEEAARDFGEEKRGLQEAGLLFTASVTSLDLATIYLRQGRISDGEAVAWEALRVFQEIDIPDQAKMALLVLRRALELRLISVGLLHRAAEFFRRIEHDSSAVFDPGS